MSFTTLGDYVSSYDNSESSGNRNRTRNDGNVCRKCEQRHRNCQSMLSRKITQNVSDDKIKKAMKDLHKSELDRCSYKCKQQTQLLLNKIKELEKELKRCHVYMEKRREMKKYLSQFE